MVDAQAPGVAAALRGLADAATPASPRGGPGGLLAEYALLHLLIRAHERLGQLPGGTGRGGQVPGRVPGEQG